MLCYNAVKISLLKYFEYDKKEFIMIDINERTHKKETAEFISACQIFEIFSIIGLVAFIAAALFLLWETVFNAERASAAAEMAVFSVIISNICNIICCIGICIALKFSASIFGKLKDGETPFRYDIGDKIRAAGITLAATGAIVFVIKFVCNLLNSIDVIADIIPVELNDSSLCLVGALLCIFSYIFNYGCKRQQESDETL